jgi:hypothetical protein
MNNTDANALFVTAARKKFRFETSKGGLNTEDLFDLSLESLDAIAVNLDKKVESGGKKSFIGKRDTSTSENESKLEIVKFVIQTKLEEAEARKNRAEKASQKEFLASLLEKKRMAQLEGLSIEEIQKQIDAL